VDGDTIIDRAILGEGGCRTGVVSKDQSVTSLVLFRQSANLLLYRFVWRRFGQGNLDYRSVQVFES
jgi:hypothetical protein